jgi:CHAT domain-containing protein
MLRSGAPTPLRVLIFGANSGDLPGVDEEAKAVEEIYAAWYKDLGWPKTDLLRLDGKNATAFQLKKAIDTGFHVIHFAGHGVFAGGEAALAVIDSNNSDEYAEVPAVEFCDWASGSELRLVYLSSCSGAGTIPPGSATIRRFESLAPALVEAGVPEVVGFFSPILDTQARTFAERFHREFLGRPDPATLIYSGEFDVATAALKARRSFPTDSQIWATSLVLSQRDSNSRP